MYLPVPPTGKLELTTALNQISVVPREFNGEVLNHNNGAYIWP